MNEIELQSFFQRAIKFSVQPGANESLFVENPYPGGIYILFNNADIDDYILFRKGLTSLKEYNFSIKFVQKSKSKVDLTIIIESPNAVILSIYDIDCKYDNMERFFKRHDRAVPLLLFLNIDNGGDAFFRLMESDPTGEFNQGISIHRWEGIPFGTSSNDATVV